MEHLLFFGETLAMLDFQGDETDVSEIRSFLLEQCRNDSTISAEPNPASCFLQTVYLLPNIIASVSNLKNPKDISAFFQFVYDTTPFRIGDFDPPQKGNVKDDIKYIKDKHRIVVGADDNNHSLILGTIKDKEVNEVKDNKYNYNNISYHLYPPIPLPITDIHWLVD